MSLPKIIEISSRRKIGAIAQQILDGTIGIIAAAREIAPLRHSGKIGESDPDVQLFVAIESDTDELPVGAVRAHWAPDALAQKDVEIAEAEAFYRERVLEVCLRLVSRYAHESIPDSAYDYYTPNT